MCSKIRLDKDSNGDDCMSFTERTPLAPGTELHILEENGGCTDWIVHEVVGYGGSCIVYRKKPVPSADAGESSRSFIRKGSAALAGRGAH